MFVFDGHGPPLAIFSAGLLGSNVAVGREREDFVDTPVLVERVEVAQTQGVALRAGRTLFEERDQACLSNYLS